MLTRARVLNMKIVREHVRNSKLVRNSEYWKSDNFRKLSVLAQILRFLQKIHVLLEGYGQIRCLLFYIMYCNLSIFFLSFFI